MKKIFSLSLLVLLLITSVPTFAFNDISKQDWYEPYVSKAAGLNFVKGYNDGSFKPKNNVTVAEFIAMTISALDSKGNFSLSYNDDKLRGASYSTSSNGEGYSTGTSVSGGLVIGTHVSYPSTTKTGGNKWYSEQVAIAESFRLTDVDPSEYERIITRGEMAYIIDRALELLGEKDSVSFNTKIFSDEINAIYKPSVLNLYEKGIIKGFPDRTFRQNNPATRAEAVTMILKMIE